MISAFVYCTLAAILLQLSAADGLQTEFYLGFMRNFRGSSSYTRLVITSTTNEPTSISVGTMETSIFNGSVTSTSPLTVDVPSQWTVQSSQVSQRSKGVLVTANSSAVSVVAANVYKLSSSSGTSDAYNVLPRHDLSQQRYEYYAMSISSTLDGTNRASQILLVGNEDHTAITITPSKDVSLPLDPSNDSSTVTVQKGQAYSITLHRLQTLLIMKANQDLTGTKIVSSKPLTVLSGHECGNVPQDVRGCDHVAVNTPPSSTWGREFILLPFIGKPSGQLYKMLSAVNDTVVQRECSGGARDEIQLGTAGVPHVFHTSPFSSCHLLSNHPLLVVQLSQGSGLDNVGDPTMILLAPVEQYVNKLSFKPLSTSDFATSYIDIATTEEYFNAADILLNGQPVEADWSMINNNGSVVGWGTRLALPSSANGYVVTHKHTSGRLSAIVYGFDTAPRHSYGYLAGLIYPPPVIEPVMELTVVGGKTNVIEGANITIRVSRTKATQATTTVHLTTATNTANQTASLGMDYHLPVTELVFLPGETDKLVTIATHDDSITENAERFIVSLSAPPGVVLGNPSEAVLTILDNDDVEVGFLGQPQLAHEELNITVAILKGQLQDGVEVGVALDHKYLQLTGNAPTTDSPDEKSTSTHVTLSSSVTQRSVMLNVSNLIRSADNGFVLLTLSNLDGDKLDHTPLLISVGQLLLHVGAMGTAPPVATSTVLPTPSSSAICPSPTPAVRETAFVTLTITSQCPELSTQVVSTPGPATTSQQVQRPRSTEVPSTGITIDQLMITRMTFVAIIVAIVLCVLVVILLVGCGVCFLCLRRKSCHEQKNVSLITSRSTVESTI